MATGVFKRALRVSFVVAILSLSQLAVVSGPAQGGDNIPDPPIAGTVGNAFTTDQQNFCGECGRGREG